MFLMFVPQDINHTLFLSLSFSVTIWSALVDLSFLSLKNCLKRIALNPLHSLIFEFMSKKPTKPRV
ncbi:hypothetical protein BpHYR1_026144 [Brachionus plicatilis]|uniref:Uncharacterized protein n=1 Tax=Brachionus plicatilis TaxID=10195 RepID=A0A3M7T784_BRAPC|nr:hypothetical protein BpHYR1_026144 [Brachionus plicatilis]